MPFNPLPIPCDTSIISPILQIGKLRGSERLSDLPEVTQSVSVRAWIHTQMLLAKAQHPSFHSTISLSASQTIMEEKMSSEKELDSRPSVESSSPSVGLQWGFLPPPSPGLVLVWLPLVSHSAPVARPALTMALTAWRGDPEPPQLWQPWAGQWRCLGVLPGLPNQGWKPALGQASEGSRLPPRGGNPVSPILASSCPERRERGSSYGLRKAPAERQRLLGKGAQLGTSCPASGGKHPGQIFSFLLHVSW